MKTKKLTKTGNTKVNMDIQEEYDALLEKAKEIFPDMDENIKIINSMSLEEAPFVEFYNLSEDLNMEISSNKTTL